MTTTDKILETKPGVSKRVRLGIVGANFGAAIARNIARGNPYTELVAICDADASKAAALAAELGVCAYSSLDELLADPSLDAVGLFTPPAGRAKLIQHVLRAGRHVMTTKPFELDIEAARSVLEEAAELGLAVHLNSPSPVPAEDIAQIKAWVSEHNLGQPIGLRAETWANYREQANGHWFDDPARCPAAPLFRLGIYLLNDFAFLLGVAKKVHVMQTRIFTGRPTSDNAQLSIEFENGALANIFASFCIGDGSPYPDKVTLNYERGTIYRSMERFGGHDMAKDRAFSELHCPETAVIRAVTQPGAYAGWYDWEAFHDAIRGTKAVPLQNSENILFGVRVLDAMRRSALSGAPELVH